MSDYHRETAFLKHVIRFDGTDAQRKLAESIAQVQRDERCVKRGASLMVLLAGLAAAGFAYEEILQDNSSRDASLVFLKFLFEIGVASLISLAVFLVLLMVYRHKLNRLRHECRLLATKILESRLGAPGIAASAGARSEADAREGAQSAAALSNMANPGTNAQPGIQ